MPKLIFDLAPLRQVGVDLQYSGRTAAAVPPHRPPAQNVNHRAIPAGMLEFALPIPGRRRFAVDFLERFGMLRREQIVRDLADRVRLRPAVHALRPLVPVADRVVGIERQDRVARQLQQLRLLAHGVGGLDGLLRLLTDSLLETGGRPFEIGLVPPLDLGDTADQHGDHRGEAEPLKKVPRIPRHQVRQREAGERADHQARTVPKPGRAEKHDQKPEPQHRPEQRIARLMLRVRHHQERDEPEACERQKIAQQPIGDKLPRPLDESVP